jgi:hypothetical protein
MTLNIVELASLRGVRLKLARRPGAFESPLWRWHVTHESLASIGRGAVLREPLRSFLQLSSQGVNSWRSPVAPHLCGMVFLVTWWIGLGGALPLPPSPRRHPARIMPPVRPWGEGEGFGTGGIGRAAGFCGRPPPQRPASLRANLPARSDAPSLCGRTAGRVCFHRPIFCHFLPLALKAQGRPADGLFAPCALGGKRQPSKKPPAVNCGASP